MDETKSNEQLTEAIGVLAQAITELQAMLKALADRLAHAEEAIVALTKLVDLNRAALQQLLPAPPKEFTDVN